MPVVDDNLESQEQKCRGYFMVSSLDSDSEGDGMRRSKVRLCAELIHWNSDFSRGSSILRGRFLARESLVSSAKIYKGNVRRVHELDSTAAVE
ncbi:hypothetical protein RRG08_024511 [Elysia crispata]|uniref:Uncharacterized protein n=1 Tax=Elysia crispata TaxID=231223 RepID=A0AAE1AYP2_9GAST|nr:hypothetical protein RRG08_024511 [Elysia crispata]